MEVILGLSQNSYNVTTRVQKEVNHSKYDLGEHKQMHTMSHIKPTWHNVILSTRTYALDQKYSSICHRCHKQLADFLLQKGSSAGLAKQRIHYLKEILSFHKATIFIEHKFVCKLGSQRVFPHQGFTFPQSH